MQDIYIPKLKRNFSF